MLKITIEGNEDDFTLLFYTAKQNYIECINNKENEFLKDEVTVSLDSIQLVEKDIKIVLTENTTYPYQIEVNLMLYAEDKEIGKYTYIEDEMGNGIDDILVFY